MVVPGQYNRLMALPNFDKHALSSFVMKFSTSAPFSAELKADVLERWPGGMVEFYGMTEGGGVGVLEVDLYKHMLSSVGRPGIDHDICLTGDYWKRVPPAQPVRAAGNLNRSA